MAFLFQDQNQGIRNDIARAKAQASRPFSFIRTLTVGFGITPNLLTLFLGELHRSSRKEGARGLGLFAFTAGGDFHPALRTSAARLSGLRGTMTNGRDTSKDLSMGNLHVPNDSTAGLRRFEARRTDRESPRHNR
jgi:hypothetical protein